MKLDTLKKTWQQGSSKYQQQNLSKEEISAALNKKTRTITDKIERKIKIAFFIVLAYIILDLSLSSLIYTNTTIDIPVWITIIGYSLEIFIFSAFLLFVYRFYKVKKRCKANVKLKEKLEQNIAMLKLYEKIYYYVFFVFIGGIAVSFLSGVYKGVVSASENFGTPASEITTNDLLIPMGIGVLIGIIICFLIFLVIRWIFRRLFGQYTRQLQLTLKELKEVDH